jgi:hypothetical protein
MDNLNQSVSSGVSLPARNSRRGRGKGDAILVAWDYARERGDLEVAEQMRLEYIEKVNESPATMSVDRRGKVDSVYDALTDLWTWLMRS